MHLVYVTMWFLAVAGYSYTVYLMLRRRFTAVRHGENWATLTRWTAGAGANNWRMATNRLTALILASLPVWGCALYFYNRASLEAVGLFLVIAGAVPASIVLLDWASARVGATLPERTGTLQAAAIVAVVLYALLLALWLWYAQTTTASPVAAKRPLTGNLWAITNRLAIAIRQNPTYNLRAVDEHITVIFMSPRTAYELYEIGEQKGVFPFHKRSYAGLQRWGALDTLLTALVEHARIAARRGDWQRCNHALQLALRTMKEASELRVPDDLKPRLDPYLVPAQSFALIHIRSGFERIYPLLKEIASGSPARKHYIEHALQQGKQVGELLAEAGRKSRPLLGMHRQPVQRRQLEAILDESLRKMSLQLLRWRHSVEDALTRISAMEVDHLQSNQSTWSLLSGVRSQRGLASFA